MRDRSALHFVLCLLLHSSSDADDVRTSSETDTQTDTHFCQKTSSAGLGRTRLSFLRNVVGTYTLLLYVSIWSEDKQLVKCAMHYDPIVSVNYLSLCRGERSENKVEVSHFNISLLLSMGSPCALHPADGLKFTNPKDIDQLEQRHQNSEAKSRRKRAWIFPGTLWCGTGTKAIDYDQLGMFERGDRCCREHDHCSNTIPAFTVNYGVFNSNFFTVSHCDCDQRFRQCLMGVNDTISNMVGYSFFNILKVPCFEFKPKWQCTELNWWGMCKVAKEAPYAVFKNPSVYNITRMTSRKGDTSDFQTSAGTGGNIVTATASTSPIRKVTRGRRPKPSAPSRSCVHRGPPRGDTFQLKHRRGKGCSRDRKTSQTQTTIPSTQITASLMQRTASLTKENVYTIQRTASKANTKTSQAKRTKTNKKKTSSRTEITSISHRSPALPPKTIHPRQRTTSTTQRTTVTMLKAAPQPTSTLTTITSTPKSPKLKARKTRHHCGHRAPPRGERFQPHRLRGERRKACLQQIAALLTPTLPSTSKTVSPTQRTMAQTQRTMASNKTTIPLTKMTSSTLSRTTIAKTSSKLRTKPLIQTTVFPSVSGSLKQRNSPSPWENIVKSISTDNLLLCGTLKHLDECKYKIPPLEKRYDLQNMESKTMYHCDCTSRLAGQIRSFKMPNQLQSLLKDFVSLSCFKDPSLKNCPEGKSCAAGFSKATDLLQALKNMEKRRRLKAQSTSKDSKGGTPFRLYKRCLRIVEPEKLRLTSSKH